MKTLSPRGAGLRSAFTLIEILTVIAIISILIGFLMPVLVKVRDRVRRSMAQNETRQIVAAVSAYVTEYGKSPSLSSGPLNSSTSPSNSGSDTVIGSSLANAQIPNSALFNTLRAIAEEPNIDHRLNPRKTIYFTTKSVSDAEHPRNGFVDRASSNDTALKGCLYDPWGTQYNIILDTNGDNLLDVNRVYSDFNESERPRGVSAGAFSCGPDQKLGTKGDGRFGAGTSVSDDIVSWK
jgi:prepilin-type N-terminal cleavage/methylation domain-containing protein